MTPDKKGAMRLVVGGWDQVSTPDDHELVVRPTELMTYQERMNWMDALILRALAGDKLEVRTDQDIDLARVKRETVRMRFEAIKRGENNIPFDPKIIIGVDSNGEEKTFTLLDEECNFEPSNPDQGLTFKDLGRLYSEATRQSMDRFSWEIEMIDLIEHRKKMKKQ